MTLQAESESASSHGDLPSIIDFPCGSTKLEDCNDSDDGSSVSSAQTVVVDSTSNFVTDEHEQSEIVNRLEDQLNGSRCGSNVAPYCIPQRRRRQVASVHHTPRAQTRTKPAVTKAGDSYNICLHLNHPLQNASSSDLHTSHGTELSQKCEKHERPRVPNGELRRAYALRMRAWEAVKEDSPSSLANALRRYNQDAEGTISASSVKALELGMWRNGAGHGPLPSNRHGLIPIAAGDVENSLPHGALNVLEWLLRMFPDGSAWTEGQLQLALSLAREHGRVRASMLLERVIEGQQLPDPFPWIALRDGSLTLVELGKCIASNGGSTLHSGYEPHTTPSSPESPSSSTSPHSSPSTSPPLRVPQPQTRDQQHAGRRNLYHVCVERGDTDTLLHLLRTDAATSRTITSEAGDGAKPVPTSSVLTDLDGLGRSPLDLAAHQPDVSTATQMVSAMLRFGCLAQLVRNADQRTVLQSLATACRPDDYGARLPIIRLLHEGCTCKLPGCQCVCGFGCGCSSTGSNVAHLGEGTCVKLSPDPYVREYFRMHSKASVSLCSPLIRRVLSVLLTLRILWLHLGQFGLICQGLLCCLEPIWAEPNLTKRAGGSRVSTLLTCNLAVVMAIISVAILFLLGQPVHNAIEMKQPW